MASIVAWQDTIVGTVASIVAWADTIVGTLASIVAWQDTMECAVASIIAWQDTMECAVASIDARQNTMECPVGSIDAPQDAVDRTRASIVPAGFATERMRRASVGAQLLDALVSATSRWYGARMSDAPTTEGNGREVTLARWGEMDEDEPGELVDGRIVEDEDVGVLHEVVVIWLGWVLRSWLASNPGFVGGSDGRFGVAPRRGRKPDLFVYLAGRTPPAQGLVTLPPDIMIEVVSPRPQDARRDRVEKMREYAAFGVRFYWIVDPGIRSFEIVELDGAGRYSYAVGVSEGRIERVPGCEGLAIDVDALWREVDRLQPEVGPEGEGGGG
jgi:Uma2 family endonuclease